MRPEEARTLAEWIGALDLPSGAVCLNIGSSTGHFREVEQPHIAECLIRPLEQRGVRFIHCDMKHSAGVDEVGDILDPKVRARLKRHGALLLICSNLFEHLQDPNAFARACGDLVADGGYGVFTVPSSYPYHPDPIDTMLRPSPSELAAMLPGWAVVKSCELRTGTYWDDLRKAPKPLVRLARHALRVAMPFYRRRTWRTNASRLLWLFRPYEFSLVLLRKPGSPPATPKGRARTRARAAR
jgi:hypothetical protein